MSNKILRLIFLIYVLSPIKLTAQNNAWVDMFSYLKVFHIQQVEDKIYAQSENAFFNYDTGSGEIEKISSINGLTGEIISNFYYHKDLKKLFVFHHGGLIEVVDEQKNVFRSPELFYNTFIPIEKKALNRIFAHGNLLYLATKYGISVYDLENNEFGDTYYFNGNQGNIEVRDVAVFNQKIYAATGEGLYRADFSDNLINQNVWSKIDNGNWSNLLLFNQNLIGFLGNNIVRILDPGVQNLLSFGEQIKSLQAGGAYLNVTFNHKVRVYNQAYILQNTFTDNTFTDEFFYDAVDFDDYLYIATKKHGVLKTPLNQTNYESIHPDSPLSNHAYGVDAREGVLWMAYGDLFELNPYPLYREGLSSYQNKSWVNIPYNDFQISDVCYVKINPTNKDEVYFASVHNGLIRVRNNQIDQIFNQNNSPLQLVSEDNSIRVFGLDFDSQNNLWLTQRMRPALLKLKPDDTWEGISMQSVFPDINDYHGFTDVKVDDADNVWIGTEYKGMVAYNQQNNQLVFLKNGLHETAYPMVKTLDFDKDNVLWVGNNNGLRILNNPDQIFSNNDITFKPIKIVYENAVQLLMEGQNITKIKADGSNNKWIATLGSGVYYFSDDGKQTIYHFTKENSPLPSNDVYDVAVDGSTGMVYFATLQGLVGYKGFATEGGDNMDDVYTFPNPANQKKHQFVTIRGLIEGVNVKIVDVAGNLVYETTSKGGSIQWDLTAFGKYKVASGVYIALITNEDGSKTQTTKILVIK